MSKIELSPPNIAENSFLNIAKYLEKEMLNWDPTINFENSLKEYLGQNKWIVPLSSGTAAIHLGLILLGVESGDEVICQSLTFVASANPIKYLGAKPVFVDSEEETLNICPKALEEAIQNRIENGVKPKAIVAVHLYGMPYKHREIRAIADKYEIPILEDAAEALGSIYYGENCGTLGDISILSFNKNKIITTFGGGALICNNSEIKDKAIFLANQAKDNAPHYQHSQIGYNYRLNDLSAILGLEQLKILHLRLKQKKSINEFYKKIFDNFDKVTLLKEVDTKTSSNHWLSVILLEDYEQREKLRLALADENIESRPLWKPMHLQPVFSDAMYFGGEVSEKAFERGLCLPSGSNLTDDDRDRIKNCILHALK
uniref:DegT/DnrJ/EryC1/StrS family aminotransferase n=1 Tax=Ornithobacterium rhinotracheale TaxID=28251 RepID=UPI0039A54936